MGTFLKVVVILLLILSIVALVFAVMLFNKREILKGRVQKLEKMVIAVGTTIESEPAAAPDPKPTYVAKDVSPATLDFIDNPQKSTEFWDTYLTELEAPVDKHLDLTQNLIQLMTYYKFRVNPATGKQEVETDAMGNPVTTGEGTMQSVLDHLFKKAGEQHDLLDKTRKELTKTRLELIKNIEELNPLKVEHRAKLKVIEELKAEIARLQGEIRRLEQNIKDLEAQIVQLKATIDQQKGEIAQLQEDKKTVEQERDLLKRKYEELRARIGESGPSALPPSVGPGQKGRVVSVNPDWRFMIIELTDDFMKELCGPDLSKDPGPVDLSIMRGGQPDKFLTKVRMVNVKKAEKLGICDMLIDWTDWKLRPVQKNDLVFYP